MDLVTNKTAHTLKLGTTQNATLETDSFLEVQFAEAGTREITAVKSDLLLKLISSVPVTYHIDNMMCEGNSLVGELLAVNLILNHLIFV